MRVIVGLGNPGRKYARTRHNAGFLVADAIVARWKLDQTLKWHEGEARDGYFSHEKVVVVKPSTYMNRSGDALRDFLYFAPQHFNYSRHLLVICDDFALPLGTFRLRPAGSAGGHNGLVSVEQALGSDQYVRLRVGVGPLPPGIGDWAEFVLAPWAPDEERVLTDLMPTIEDAVECWVQEGIEIAMTRYNKRAPAS